MILAPRYRRTDSVAGVTTIDPDVVQWREGTGGDLLVLLHGLGSNELDLFGLVPHLPERFTIASLRAPLRYGPGFAWFEFGGAADPANSELIDDSGKAVLTWLDSLGQPYDNIHLLGFSQGGAVAVQLARLAPERFATIAHLASFVHPGPQPRDAELAALEPRIRVLSTIGDFDEVIGQARAGESALWLDEHFDVERHNYPRGHSIVQEELGDLIGFLERA